MFKYVYFFLSLLLLVHCSDDTKEPLPPDCSKVACTEVFITLTVQVQDRNGVKIPLDSFRVTDSDSGTDLTPDYTPATLETYRQDGTYPLIDDRFVSDHRNEDHTLIFVGFIGEEEVVRGTYHVNVDCCHVSLLSGKEILIIGRDGP